MSDDEDDKGKKTNASPEHKPKDVARNDVAPIGSVGRNPAGLSGPGLGTSSQGRVVDQTSHQPQPDQKITFRRSQDQAKDQGQDDRPIALDSKDMEVNADTDAKGERRLSMEEIKREAGTDRSAETDKADAAQEQRREENRGMYAPITGEKDIDQQSIDDGYTMIEQDDYDRMKAEKLREQMQARRDLDKDRGR